MAVRTALRRARPGAKHGARRSPQGTAPRPARERVRVSGRRDTGRATGTAQETCGARHHRRHARCPGSQWRQFDENRASADARLRSHLGHRHGGRGQRPRCVGGGRPAVREQGRSAESSRGPEAR
ncbi:hypothetical protein ERJ75_000297900 [Trypanosoma vivax]|nr:hypothetical protein ERJ75_000297900 [Trypanosoma vivax]